MRNILIYGSSGHAKMIIDIVHLNKNYNITGFIDSYKSAGEIIYGYELLGDLNMLSSLIEKHNVFGIVIAIGDNNSRKNAHKKILSINSKIKFISLVHPSAILSESVILGKGSVIMADVVINADAMIGEFCILNTKASFGHDSTMREYSSLASGVVVAGNVRIGRCSAICLGAAIIQQVSIGKHTVVGAGSLVLKSIGDYKTVWGVPINTINDRKEDSKYLG